MSENEKVNPVAVIDCAIHTLENMAAHGLPNRELARIQASALDRAKQEILKLVEIRNELARHSRDALDFIVHSQANRNMLTTDEQWRDNVESFRRHLGIVEIGRDYVPKASVNLGAMDAALRKAADQAWEPVPALAEPKPAPALTFLAYQQARRQVSDLHGALPDLWEGMKDKPGFVYPAQGWIYVQDGVFNVDLDRETHSSKSLDVLEAKLYTFAADMGYLDMPKSPRSRLAVELPKREAPTSMTYDDFVASRLVVDDIGSVTGADELRGIPGVVYGGHWYIEKAPDGVYQLPIENYEVHSHSLDVLEAHLYEYARGELLGENASSEPDAHLLKLRDLAARGGIVHELHEDKNRWRWRMGNEVDWRAGTQYDERTVLVHALDAEYGHNWRGEVSDGFSNKGFVDWLEVNMPPLGFMDSYGAQMR